MHALFSPEILRAGAVKGLSEVSGVVVSCFTLSRLSNVTDVSVRKPDDSFSPLFKTILFSV